MNPRERLRQQSFDSLDAMMAAYSSQAMETAAAEFGKRLDYSPTSIAVLEEILASLGAPTAEDQEYLTMLWGSYLGETLLREFGGEWTMSVYPGSDLAVPTILLRGSRLYPLMKVFRRLTLGEAENVAGFYRLVQQRIPPEKPQ